MLAAVCELTNGGASVAIDAVGSAQTCFDSIASLRTRGRLVQVGLMRAEDRRALVANGSVHPGKLIGKLIALEDAPKELAAMGDFAQVGVSVVNRF